jgi:hypothetical protein
MYLIDRIYVRSTIRNDWHRDMLFNKKIKIYLSNNTFEEIKVFSKNNGFTPDTMSNRLEEMYFNVPYTDSMKPNTLWFSFNKNKNKATPHFWDSDYIVLVRFNHVPD